MGFQRSMESYKLYTNTHEHKYIWKVGMEEGQWILYDFSNGTQTKFKKPQELIVQ